MATFDRTAGPPLHPLHAILVAFPIAGFVGTVMTDITYLNTAEMQWSNFSAWLNAVGLFFGGFALLWAIIAWVRSRRGPLYPLLLLAGWIVGLVNAFHHSGDAWQSVGTSGLILSLVSAALVLAAAWVAFSSQSAAA